MWRNVPTMTLDRFMGGSVVLASGYVVYQAYSEGNFPLTKHVADFDARCPRLLLDAKQCRSLETDGYLVIDDFLTPDEVSKAAHAAREIQKTITKQQVVFLGIRESSLAHFDASYVGGTESVPDAQPYHDAALLHVRRLVRGVAHSVRMSAFDGFRAGDVKDHSVFGVPDTLQLSLYRAHHCVANYNAAHRDGSSHSTIWQTGLLGHLRSKYLRHRYLTCILYLNDDIPWDVNTDGGQLRIHHDDIHHDDIAPRGGRLVLLDSESVLHAVLPSQRDRIACSIWFTMR